MSVCVCRIVVGSGCLAKKSWRLMVRLAHILWQRSYKQCLIVALKWHRSEATGNNAENSSMDGSHSWMLWKNLYAADLSELMP